MKRLLMKNELGFSLVWIGLYVVLFSMADTVSRNLGTAKIITAPLCVIITVYLIIWLIKNGLCANYGLCKIKTSYRNYLYFLPLAVIASTNLWGGFTFRFSPVETALYIVSMLCVGFIEEIIFRGFLFRALCRESVKWAVIISSITFGMGHIVNLLNGADVPSTLLQICYAAAVGFLFTIIFYYSKSLIPCIITHSAINSFSAFAVERTDIFNTAAAIALIIISLVYALWLMKKARKNPPE